MILPRLKTTKLFTEKYNGMFCACACANSVPGLSSGGEEPRDEASMRVRVQLCAHISRLPYGVCIYMHDNVCEAYMLHAYACVRSMHIVYKNIYMYLPASSLGSSQSLLQSQKSLHCQQLSEPALGLHLQANINVIMLKYAILS